MLHLVPPERREKVMRFNNVSDRHMHLCGRLLLRYMINKHTGIPFPDIRFAYTKGNKPVLATPLPPGCVMPNYNFNYSHDGELVCAGSEPEVIIGGLRRKKERREKSFDLFFLFITFYLIILFYFLFFFVVDVARAHLRQNKGAEEWFRDMKRSFSANEWIQIRRGRDDRDKLTRFFVFWALKESYVSPRKRFRFL